MGFFWNKLRRNLPVKPEKVGVMIRLPNVSFLHLCRSKLNFLHVLLLARSGYISAWNWIITRSLLRNPQFSIPSLSPGSGGSQEMHSHE